MVLNCMRFRKAFCCPSSFVGRLTHDNAQAMRPKTSRPRCSLPVATDPVGAVSEPVARCPSDSCEVSSAMEMSP